MSIIVHKNTTFGKLLPFFYALKLDYYPKKKNKGTLHKPLHKFQICVSVHHIMIIENTSLMQQDKYIFHLYVFSSCFGRDITHHQELQNCTRSDMVMVPREVRRDVVEEIKWRLARQYYARVGDV